MRVVVLGALMALLVTLGLVISPKPEPAHAIDPHVPPAGSASPAAAPSR